MIHGLFYCHNLVVLLSSFPARRKRKWDQPADSLLSTGVAVPGVYPLGNVGSLVGIALPGVFRFLVLML